MPHSTRHCTIAAAVVLGGATVLHALAGPSSYASLPQDRGASGTWQKLLKLRTIGSVMHTTAHPDDEHGGLLAMLSRGEGARVTLLTLNRGEAGDNAIGSELFDPLGLIRTEELLRADQYYGVDEQYFTSVIDYGFSKRLEEALVKWGREHVLRDVVRVIRIERPLVLIARFQGNERDGHGNHQAAGLITQEAYRVAGDPNVFPSRFEGLRPWQPLKLYMGGCAKTRTGRFASIRRLQPWLGESCRTSRAPGSAFSARRTAAATICNRTCVRFLHAGVAGRCSAEGNSFFDGIDIRDRHVRSAEAPGAPNASTLLGAIQREIDAAVRPSRWRTHPPPCRLWRLADSHARNRATAVRRPDAVYMLKLKGSSSSTDQHRARHRFHRDRSACRDGRAHRPDCRLRGAADAGTGRAGAVARCTAAIHESWFRRC
jgi:LmbE family N-acetylglucosaminyl deacetylase